MIKQISSGTLFSNAATHVGPSGYLFYDPESTEIRCSDGVTPGGVIMGGGPIMQTKVLLTSAQLLGCNTTPVEILPAPGDGQLYVIISSFYSLVFGTTPYSGDGTGLWYGTSVSADLTGNGVFNGSASQVQQSLGWSFEGNPLPSLCVNSPINLWSPNSALTGGDGTGSITLFYSIIQP